MRRRATVGIGLAALFAERKEWLWDSGDVAADEVRIDPSDCDGGFGPGSYFAHVMEKDD